MDQLGRRSAPKAGSWWIGPRARRCRRPWPRSMSTTWPRRGSSWILCTALPADAPVHLTQQQVDGVTYYSLPPTGFGFFPLQVTMAAHGSIRARGAEPGRGAGCGETLAGPRGIGRCGAVQGCDGFGPAAHPGIDVYGLERAFRARLQPGARGRFHGDDPALRGFCGHGEAARDRDDCQTPRPAGGVERDQGGESWANPPGR